MSAAFAVRTVIAARVGAGRREEHFFPVQCPPWSGQHLAMPCFSLHLPLLAGSQRFAAGAVLTEAPWVLLGLRAALFASYPLEPIRGLLGLGLAGLE